MGKNKGIIHWSLLSTDTVFPSNQKKRIAVVLFIMYIISGKEFQHDISYRLFNF